MKVAYADPPYVKCCALYGHFHGDDGRCWDDLETTLLLLDRLNRDYPDGWAMSCKGNLQELVVLGARAGPTARLSPWLKPFHSFKPNVNPSHGWEGVIWKATRKRDRYEPTVKDFYVGNITLKKGLTGAKPYDFNRWILELLGCRPTDQVDDLFPGTGGMGVAIRNLQAQSVFEPPAIEVQGGGR
jgi:hypothetical protein